MIPPPPGDPLLSDPWQPIGAASIDHPPDPHRLIAYRHAVWHVDQVDHPAPITDTDQAAWVKAGRPDPATPEVWHGWPYIVHATWLAGWRQKMPTGHLFRTRIRIPARSGPYGKKWWIYPATNRWPRCSCCGWPMPCRQDIIDARAAAEMADLNRHLAKLPGCCWGCTEPITSRQNTVTYPGDNLDLPGGPAVQFHTRTHCAGAARDYERRWLAADLARDPVLTGAPAGTLL